MGIYTNLAKTIKARREAGQDYSGMDKMILYGAFNKSTLMASLTEVTGKPVLAITPAGTSKKLEKEFPLFMSYTINNLQEYHQILDDILADVKKIDTIRQYILADNKVGLEKVKLALKEEYNEYYDYAKNNTYPLSAVVVEETNLISNWVVDKVEQEFDLKVIGEDKKNLGKDWNVVKRDIIDTFGKALRLPVFTCFSTSSIEPTEKQNITKRMPDLCVGAAQRVMIDMIGNIFYTYRTPEQRYKIRLVENKDTYCKDKLLPVKTTIKLEEEIDLTGDPKKFWQYIKSLNTDIKVIK